MAELIGGSGKTYRLADNLTTDYQDFSEIQDLWENTVVDDQMLMELVAASDETMKNHAHTPFVMDAVSTSQTAMDAVSTSATAMDAVSTSATAMDAVSASQTARDAVNASDLAYDTIAAVEMAIGKFVAGSAGLTPGDYADIAAVASSQSAMDAVSTSSTAMDAVSTSLLARSAALGSSYAVGSIWSENYASQRIWDEGTIEGTGTNTPSWVSPTFDLSNAATLKIDTERSEYGDVKVYVDGTNIFSNGSNHNSTTRSLDVSGYNGEHTIELEWDRGFDGTQQTFVDSGTGGGVAMKFFQDGQESSRFGKFRDVRFE